MKPNPFSSRNLATVPVSLAIFDPLWWLVLSLRASFRKDRAAKARIRAEKGPCCCLPALLDRRREGWGKTPTSAFRDVGRQLPVRPRHNETSFRENGRGTPLAAAPHGSRSPTRRKAMEGMHLHVH